jgi:FKBP-type peptidyl-prolyl cis-trans isomerase
MNLKFLAIATIAISACAAWAEEQPASSSAPFKDEKEKFSYALGMNYGSMFARQDIEVDLDNLMKGIKDTVSSNKTLLTEEQMRQVLTEAQRRFAAKRQEKLKLQAEENRKKADAFLAENKGKPGVITTESGLQYKVLAEGSGASPGSNDMVTVNYRGTLMDGTEFDSSYKRNQPFTTPVTRVIKGWSEALQKMKPGAKWQLYIPPSLAYGDNPAGAIPPGSLLEFEVEMLSNSPPPAPPSTTATPLTSDIIKVPSLEEMKKGAKIETIKAEDVEKEIEKQKELEKQKQAPK